MLKSLLKILRRKADPLMLLKRVADPSVAMKTLVHVGAHLAQERHGYEALGYRRLLWIEASSEVHARLSQGLSTHLEQLRATGIADIEHLSICALLTDRDGDEVVLREFSNDGLSNSIFGGTDAMRARWPEVHEAGLHQPMLSRTLDGLLAEIDFAPVDVLVVDVQGAELLVLRGASATLAQAKALVCEVSTLPLYEGGVLFPELREHLAGYGFLPMSLPPRHGDMLFVHPERVGYHP